MPFKIIRNDITKVSADAIVNTANPFPAIGRETDSAIYDAAGKVELLAALNKIGVIEKGKAAWTDSFNLKQNGVKYIIHTVGTSYNDGENGEVDILRSCYSFSLNIAKKLGCKSVAIPLLTTGFYSFPKEIGLQIAIDEISHFLIENEIEVYLVVCDRKSYLISEKLYDDIQNFIEENYEQTEKNGIICHEKISIKKKRHEIVPRTTKSCNFSENLIPFESEKKTTTLPVIAKSLSLSLIDVDAFINQSTQNLNFQNTLQQLIADRHLENATVYSKALIDRKFFSKIISNKNYVPKKMTVMALGLALELKLEEYESFLASAGYAFMPSSKFDVIVKYCVMNGIYNLVEVDMILDSYGECCFAPV